MKAFNSPTGAQLAAALDMSTASRLARAKQLGFTVDAYKGLQPYDYNTMPVLNGMGRPIGPQPSGPPKELSKLPAPSFFSNDPSVANRFAQTIARGTSVLPAKLKFDNPLVIDAQGKPAGAFQFEELAKDHEVKEKFDAYQDALKDSKYDGIILKNTKDEGDVYIPKSSNQIRSRFAKFDPAMASSGDMSA